MRRSVMRRSLMPAALALALAACGADTIDADLADMALADMALDDMALDDMALDDMALDDMALEDMALEDMALEDMAVDDIADTAIEAPPAPFESDALIGTWTSACEPGPVEFAVRQLTFTADRWQVFVTAFDDRDCTEPMFSFEMSGDFEITGGSALGADVAEVTFRQRENRWTAYQDSLLMALTVNDCGTEPWALGVPQDVSQTGCLGFAYPLEDCPNGESDLLRLADGALFVGERPFDLCVMRSPAVSDLPAWPMPDAVQLGGADFAPSALALDFDEALYVGASNGEIRRAARYAVEAAALVEPGALGGAVHAMAAGGGGLLVCVHGDAGALVRVDAQTGAETARFALPGICAGVALDDGGAVYVADGAADAILRLPVDGDALEPWFSGEGAGFSGLVVEVDGVLVGRAEADTLVRIPLTEDGAAGEPQLEALQGPPEGAQAAGIAHLQRWRVNHFAVRDGQVVRLNPGDPWTVEVFADDAAQGITIDRAGNVWIATSNAEDGARAVRRPLRPLRVMP